MEAAALVRISDAGKGGDRTGRRAVEPRGIISEELRRLTTVEKVEFTFWMVCDFLIHPEDFVLEVCLQRGLSVSDCGHSL